MTFHNARRLGDDRLHPRGWSTHISSPDDNHSGSHLRGQIEWTDPVASLKSRYYCGNVGLYNPSPPPDTTDTPVIRYDAATSKMVNVVGANNTVGRDLAEYGGNLIVALDGGGGGGSIRQWNGTAWSDLGTGRPDGGMNQLLAWSGKLWVANKQATGLGPYVWNGSTWSVVGGGLDLISGTPDVYCMAVFTYDIPGTGPTELLFFGGRFDRVGASGPADCLNIIAWNDTTSAWVYIEGIAVTDSVHGEIRALFGYDRGDGNGVELYAGGNLLETPRQLKKFAGYSWEPAGGVLAMNTLNSITVPSIDCLGSHIDKCGLTRMLVGGRFDELFKPNAEGSGELDRLGDFDTSGTLDNATLSSPAGVNGIVRTNAVFDGDYIIGGSFETDIASGRSVPFVGLVEDGEVTALDDGVDASIYDMVVKGTKLYMTGDQLNGSSQVLTRASYYDGNHNGIGSGGLNARGRGVIVDGDHVVFVGDFDKLTTSGTPVAPGIARYKESTDTWETNIFGLGLTYLGNPAKVNCIVLDSGKYYVGGQIDKAGTTTVAGIAVFTISGGTWSALGAGVDGEVHKILIDNGGDVHAVGNFDGSGWEVWNGSSWSAKVGDDYTVSRCIIEADLDGGGLKVFVDGNDPTGNGAVPNNVAYGSPAKALGTSDGSLNDDVYCMLHDSGADLLRIGGAFTSGGTDATNGQLAVNSLVTFGPDGMQQWNGGIGHHPFVINQASGWLRRLQTFTLDNGDPELGVVGSFQGDGAHERYARGVAAYTNKGIIPMGKGVNGTHAGGFTEGGTSACRLPAVQLQQVHLHGDAGADVCGTGIPRAGTFGIKGVAGDSEQTLNYDFTNAQMATALDALTSIGSGNHTVTGDETMDDCDCAALSPSGSGGRLNPCVIEFDPSLGVVPLLILRDIDLADDVSAFPFGCDVPSGSIGVTATDVSRSAEQVVVVGNFAGLENEPGRGAALEIASAASGRFSGQVWSAMPGLPSGYYPSAVVFFAGTAWVCGQKGSVVYRFDAKSDAWVGEGHANFAVNKDYNGLIVWGDYIYLLGRFNFTGGGDLATIVRRTEHGAWTDVTPSDANMLAWHAAHITDLGSGEKLYVAGEETTSTNIVKATSNGTTWSDIGTTLDGICKAITSVDYGSGRQLVAAGNGLQVSGGGCIVATWNGTAWAKLALAGGASTVLDVFGLDRRQVLIIMGNLQGVTDGTGSNEQAYSNIVEYDPTNGLSRLTEGVNAQATELDS